MPPEVFFAGAGLDRCDHLRDDPDQLAALAGRADARELRWADGLPLLDPQGGLCWGEVGDPQLLLGLADGEPRFSPVPPGTVPVRVAVDLVGALRPAEAPVLAAALALVNWHRRHGFCANCGAASSIIRGGWARHCSACRSEHFPRVDPVVIMLAEHDGRVLLGRQPGFPAGFYSALAGFVEPGETIEAAVAREIAEEAGVTVADVRYVASQPWPFPSSLMIGCLARAVADRITLDRRELEDARWFTRREVQAALAGDGGVGLPPPFAIAHSLLRHWLGA